MSYAYTTATYGRPAKHRSNFQVVGEQPVNRRQAQVQPKPNARKSKRANDLSALAALAKIARPGIATSVIGLSLLSLATPAFGATPSSAAPIQPTFNPTQDSQSLSVSAKVTANDIVRDSYNVTTPALSPTATSSYENVGMVPDNSYFRSLGTGYDEQARHDAALIITIGRQLGFSDHAIAIAVATSIQECNLINVHYGDRDSLGLFQQQWSIIGRNGLPVWGTATQVADPVYATKRFYQSLAGVANRDTGDMKSIAIEIQNPSRAAYMRWAWDDLATQIVSSYPAS